MIDHDAIRKADKMHNALIELEGEFNREERFSDARAVRTVRYGLGQASLGRLYEIITALSVR